MPTATCRYVHAYYIHNISESDKCSDNMQDPRIAHCLQEVLHDTAERDIQQFGCNGTCEDDWPKVILKAPNLDYTDIDQLFALQGGATSKGTQQH